MISRTALRLPSLLLAFALANSHAAQAFYMMPSAFNVDAVNGSTSSHSQSQSAYSPSPGMPMGGAGVGVFDVRNRTAAEEEETRAAAASGTHDSEDAQVMRVRPRDIWNPKVTEPDGSTVWTVGSQVTVRWDTSSPPHHATNDVGKVVLGHYEDGDTSEHLDVEHPLAEGFNLTRGHVQVTVPEVKPSNEYIIVLFGDSGNASPKFTITD